MKTGPLWRVSVRTSPEAEEAVVECLAMVLGQPVSVYTNVETERTTASVYLAQRGDFSETRRAELLAGLRRIRAAGLRLERAAVRFDRMRREDWAESWKRHFKPIAIGSALLIKPSWSRRRPGRGQAVVILDPGLSFGTGQHPTTRFCLEQLAAARIADACQALLDIGTGSGILAIAAAKLGYTPISAFDSDADAVRIATANARINGVHRRIQFRCQDLAEFAARKDGRFTVVCANLIFDVLLAGRKRILKCLAPGGRLVLAGILHSQFSEVRRAYASEGLKLGAHCWEGQWESGAFVSSEH